MAYGTTDGTPPKVTFDDVYKTDEVKTDMEATIQNVSVPALHQFLLVGIIVGIIAKRY